MTDLTLRRANVVGGFRLRKFDDFDVFDGDKCVVRIYLVDHFKSHDRWFWGVSFQVTGRRIYGNASSVEDAKAALTAEYEQWKASQCPPA